MRSPLHIDRPVGAAQWLGAARIGIGVAFLLAPRALWRPQLHTPLDLEPVVLPLRMAAVRDLALGLGTLLAARRGSGAVRGWVEAGALADAADATLFSTTGSLRPAARWGTTVLAGGAAVVGQRVASRLT